jgi:hypothetical protein
MPENNQRKTNLLKRLLNTRKLGKIPKGTVSLEEARKFIKNVPLSPEEALNQMKKLGFAGGRRRSTRKRRSTRRRSYA